MDTNEYYAAVQRAADSLCERGISAPEVGIVLGSGLGGLAEAVAPSVIDVAQGEPFDLRIGPVAKRIAGETVRMLAYNGSIPGPTLRVREGSELVVHVANEGDLEATVHWHGLRLDNRYDGTHETQEAIPVGGTFTYRLEFPDPGVYWYHPHIREDYGQELGLYGNILVVPTEEDYWPPAHREVMLTLDLPHGRTLRLGQVIRGAYPRPLQTIGHPELLDLLAQFSSAAGTQARTDWSRLPDRMRFIAQLFRIYQEDITLFDPPYTPKEWAELRDPSTRTL